MCCVCVVYKWRHRLSGCLAITTWPTSRWYSNVMENKLKQSQAEDEAIDYYSNVADPFHTKSNPLHPHHIQASENCLFRQTTITNLAHACSQLTVTYSHTQKNQEWQNKNKTKQKTSKKANDTDVMALHNLFQLLMFTNYSSLNRTPLSLAQTLGVACQKSCTARPAPPPTPQS